jgi:hypothetical protein
MRAAGGELLVDNWIIQDHSGLAAQTAFDQLRLSQIRRQPLRSAAR